MVSSVEYCNVHTSDGQRAERTNVRCHLWKAGKLGRIVVSALDQAIVVRGPPSSFAVASVANAWART